MVVSRWIMPPQDGLARAGEHYIAQSGTLVMEEGQTYAHVTIPILSFGVWTNYSFDEFETTITTFNEAPFTLNLFNIRKDEGEPDYIKPQFMNANWQSTGEVTATIIVERQPYLHAYEPVEEGTQVDGWHFARKYNRVRESQGVALIEVLAGVGDLCPAYWMAMPSTPLAGDIGHGWGAARGTPGFNPPIPGGPNPAKPDLDVIPPYFYTPSTTSLYRELIAGSDYATPWYWTTAQNLTPESANVLPYPDGDLVNIGGTIDAEGGIYQILQIPLINNDEIDFNQDFFVFLWDVDPTCPSVGRWPLDYPQVTQVTIVADGDLKAKNITVDDEGVKKVNLVNDPRRGETPAGAYDRNFNPHSQYDTEPPYNFDPGANNQVHAVAAQPDGKVLIGGDFTSFNSFPLNRIARLYVDGSVDRQFAVGTGADDTVTEIELRQDGKILIGGGFRSYNGNVSYGLAELNTDGTLNAGFDVGAGFNGTVRDIKVMDNEKVLIAGNFTSYNNTNAVYLARLHPDGKIDHLFAPKRCLTDRLMRWIMTKMGHWWLWVNLTWWAI